MSDVHKPALLADAAAKTRSHAVALAERDAAVLRASDAGASLREIAEATGIAHMTVKRIIERASR